MTDPTKPTRPPTHGPDFTAAVNHVRREYERRKGIEMPRPICADCAREMVIAVTGHPVVFLQEIGDDDAQPVAVAMGDLYRCPDCIGGTVVGFGARDHDPDNITRALAGEHTEVRE